MKSYDTLRPRVSKAFGLYLCINVVLQQKISIEGVIKWERRI